MRFLVVGNGAALFFLGLLFWSGRLLNLVPLHMLLGILLVLSLWILVGMALRNGVPAGFVSLVFSWSLVLPLLGVFQGQLLPGDWHWTVQAAQLIVGAAVIGLGQSFIRRIASVRQGGYR